MKIKFWNYKAIGKDRNLVAYADPVLPTLSRGSHHEGSGYACIMEYISVLAGEAWTDRPLSVHTTLATAARVINDSLDDKDRHLLVPVITRLLGANTTDPRLHVQARNAIVKRANEYAGRKSIAIWVEGSAYSLLGQVLLHNDYSMSQVLIGFECKRPSAQKRVEFLHALIDAFDEVTGRTVEPIPVRELNAAVRKVEGVHPA